MPTDCCAACSPRGPAIRTRSSARPRWRSPATTSAAAGRWPRARAAAQPAALAPLPLLVDARVELGRFGAAERTLQRLLDAKPALAGYARASYLRELHGDLDGAVAAMRRAIAAGGPARESGASVQALLGGLELQRGRPRAARRAQVAALAAVPGFPAAEAGLARLAAARGDLRAAIRRWRALAARLPLPEYVIGLGEAQLAAGRERAGRRELALVGAEQRLAAGGVNADAELAVFEADHGDPARAVALARRAWRAAPGLRAADARGWALTRSGRPAAGLRWAHRALRLGSRDPILRFHAGIAAAHAGRRGEARAQLGTALAHGLAGWPWQAAAARDALRGAVMRRLALAAVVAAAWLALGAGTAAAHPLGNFSVNHLSVGPDLRRPRRRPLPARPGGDPHVPRARHERSGWCSRASGPRSRRASCCASTGASWRCGRRARRC